MRVRFYVEKRRGENGKLLTTRRPIFMTVAFHGKRVLISTGKFVDLKWWDPVKQRVKENSPESKVNNQWLDSLVYTAGVVWKALASLSEKPGVEDFKGEFEKLKPRFSSGFFDILLLFLEEGSERWSSGSYKKVRTFYQQMKVFEKETAYPLNFNTINATFLDKFTAFQKEEGKASSTILKMLNTLVWFLNWASREGYNVYYEYKQFYKLFEGKEEQRKRHLHYLTWEELIRFLDYKSGNVREERAVDLFCIMCLTGLKFGEIIHLKKQDVEDSCLIVRKGNKPARQVPLNRHAKQMMRKYENRFYRENAALPTISPVTMNKYLRIAAEKLQLKREVEDPDDPGKSVPLFSIMTAGLAGQTFIMNALRLDIPAEVITSFTGISNDQRVKVLQHEIAKNEIKKFDQLYPQ